MTLRHLGLQEPGKEGMMNFSENAQSSSFPGCRPRTSSGLSTGMATLIATLGIFMKPIGWQWTLVVWVYALAWFFLNDRIKLAAYRVFDPPTP